MQNKKGDNNNKTKKQLKTQTCCLAEDTSLLRSHTHDLPWYSWKQSSPFRASVANQRQSSDSFFFLHFRKESIIVDYVLFSPLKVQRYISKQYKFAEFKKGKRKTNALFEQNVKMALFWYVFHREMLKNIHNVTVAVFFTVESSAIILLFIKSSL